MVDDVEDSALSMGLVEEEREEVVKASRRQAARNREGVGRKDVDPVVEEAVVPSAIQLDRPRQPIRSTTLLFNQSRQFRTVTYGSKHPVASLLLGERTD